MKWSREVSLSTIRLVRVRTCFGLGYKMEFDMDLMIPDKRLEHFGGGNPGDGLAVLYR